MTNFAKKKQFLDKLKMVDVHPKERKNRGNEKDAASAGPALSASHGAASSSCAYLRGGLRISGTLCPIPSKLP